MAGWLDGLTAPEEGVVKVDLIVQSLAYATSLLNRIDCSKAPNCTALHRQACSSQLNTCGGCMATYIGDSGAGNSACIDESSLLAPANPNRTTSCEATTDCVGFEVCEATNSSCVVPLKSCPTAGDSECSDHGTCTYVNRTIVFSPIILSKAVFFNYSGSEESFQ